MTKLSLLRNQVEGIPDDLGTEGKWSWQPQGCAENIKSSHTSPTAEYSTEGDED